jgi:hypothetical protein
MLDCGLFQKELQIKKIKIWVEVLHGQEKHMSKYGISSSPVAFPCVIFLNANTHPSHLFLHSLPFPGLPPLQTLNSSKASFVHKYHFLSTLDVIGHLHLYTILVSNFSSSVLLYTLIFCLAKVWTSYYLCTKLITIYLSVS